MDIFSSTKKMSVFSAVAIVVGIVVGAGIFKTPSIVASESGTRLITILLWVAGGVVSLIGALCYAELAGAYPGTGGEYYYVTRAFGSSFGFLFAWARMTVIQAGSIAMLGFLIGDYATQIYDLGRYSSSYYGAAAITLLTFVNAAGIKPGSAVQKAVIGSLITGMLFVIAVGFASIPAHNSEGHAAVVQHPSWGKAMVFVLLTYGGWNEAAYLSAEVFGAQRAILRVLLYSIGTITALYVLINLAFLHGLTIYGMSGSETVAADLMRRSLGNTGASIVSILVALAAFSTMNGSIITGARTNFALGRDFSLFRFLGLWNEKGGTPVNALLFQGAIAIVLVGLGTGARGGFTAMVEYTAPVFWFFFLFIGISLFILRWKDPGLHRPFKVPLYPFLPFAFCCASAYMFVSSILYTGKGALAGLGILLAGVPVLVISLNKTKTENRR